MKRHYIALIPIITFIMAASATDTIYKKLSVFSHVYSYIKNNYVEDIPDEDLAYAAIRGMVELLDPHSSFLTPEQYKEMKEDTSGEYAGIGLEVTIKDNNLTVLSVMDDSPSSRAGIKSGDIIIEIDGKTIGKKFILEDIYKRLKGPLGSEITLKILRRPLTEPTVYKLIREKIRMQSVSAELLDGNIGYVKISSFQEKTYIQLRELLRQMSIEVGGDLLGVILDLRNNPGGLFEQAIRVADLFIRDGVIVYVQGRGKKGEFTAEMAHSDDTLPDFPLLCIVNSGSASAAEIVAGALQDHKRAIIAGEKTFGKGSVQTILELEDKSALKLTIAKYYTPNKKSIQEVGITPDIELAEIIPEKMPNSIKDRRSKGSKNKAEKMVVNSELLKKDNILYQAYNHLKAMISVDSTIDKRGKKDSR